MLEYELEVDRYWRRLIIRKTRPTWDWERNLNFSASCTEDRQVMRVWSVQQIGM